MNLSSTKIPIEIKKCPILEAVADIRFKSDFPEDVIYGVIYSQISSLLKNEKVQVLPLPILSLPPQIRDQDPNLKYQPHHRISFDSDGFMIQISPRALSFVKKKPYTGWQSFSKKITLYINKILENTDIILSAERIAVRYINFFENQDIWDNVKLKLSLDEYDKNFGWERLNINGTIIEEDIKTNIIIENKIMAKDNNSNQKLEGSIFDLDTYIEGNFEAKKILDTLEKVHLLERKIFFSYLKGDCIERLGPVYE